MSTPVSQSMFKKAIIQDTNSRNSTSPTPFPKTFPKAFSRPENISQSISKNAFLSMFNKALTQDTFSKHFFKIFPNAISFPGKTKNILKEIPQALVNIVFAQNTDTNHFHFQKIICQSICKLAFQSIFQQGTYPGHLLKAFSCPKTTSQGLPKVAPQGVFTRAPTQDTYPRRFPKNISLNIFVSEQSFPDAFPKLLPEAF